MVGKESLLTVTGMKKCFGETVALDDVSITVPAGKVLGLIGENGSGKSTITSIAAGMQKADTGEMEYMGNLWEPVSMIDSLEKGIGMIVQENGTVPGISVAENIFLADVDRFKKRGIINKKAMKEEAGKILKELGIEDIDPLRLTASLDFQSRKLIEVARVMRKNPNILVVDETTTALSQKGRTIIYNIMKKMSAEGKAVVFISHDIDEIMEHCDELTVLRDGKIIRSFSREEFDEEKIKASMIGRELKGDYYRSDYDGSSDEEVVLMAENITVYDREEGLNDFSMILHKGEILGIGGLSQCGMHTLGKVLFAAKKPEAGSVLVKGEVPKSEADAMKLGVGYVSKNRDYESLVLDASISDNIASGGLDRFAIGKYLITPKREKKYVEDQIENLEIKCQSRNQNVSALSGGNKQKVVFGKWIGRGSDILILDCPTRGIDIGVKQSMYQLMNRMKKEGKSIVIISEEMTELIGMSDRILILKDGSLAKEFHRENKPDEVDIIQYMI